MSNSEKNIKKIRQGKGISQDKLSKLSDISLNTVVKLEFDLSPNLTLETIRKRANTLGTIIDNLAKGQR